MLTLLKLGLITIVFVFNACAPRGISGNPRWILGDDPQRQVEPRVHAVPGQMNGLMQMQIHNPCEYADADADADADA